MSSDTFVCPLCHVKVKTKLKRAHDVSAKHREKLKQKAASKRSAAPSYEDTIAKRPRPETESIELHSVALKQPESIETGETQGVLPSNFFDSAVKEQQATAAEQMEKEFTRFVQEVNEIEKLDTETTYRHDAIRNELDDIDEQIEMWRNLNELEKQKEQLICDVRARLAAEPKHVITEEVDEDDEEIDISNINWRSRRI